MKKLIIIIILILTLSTVSALTIQNYLNINFNTIPINWINNGWNIEKSSKTIYNEKQITDYRLNENKTEFEPYTRVERYYVDILDVRNCLRYNSTNSCKQFYYRERELFFNNRTLDIREAHKKQQEELANTMTDEEILSMFTG